jgi:hypothetical protein
MDRAVAGWSLDGGLGWVEGWGAEDEMAAGATAGAGNG